MEERSTMTSISDSTETAFILNMTSDPESRDLFDKLFTGKYFPPTIEAIVIAVYSILMVTGFLFNFLMIVVILSSENLRRMPFNLLLLNLCVANIMLSVFCMPFTLVTLLYRSYTYGAVLCKIIPSLQGVSVCVSATTVTVIAFDRYFSIIYREQHYQPTRSRQRLPSSSTSSYSPAIQSNYCQVGVETVIIWIIGLLFGLPPALTTEFVEFREYGEYAKCTESWPPMARAVYSIVVLIVQCLLPSLALIVTGSMITSHLNILAGALGVSSQANTTAVTRGENGKPTLADHHRRNIERNQSVTRTLLTVSVSFSVCWLPLHLLNALIDMNVVSTDPLSDLDTIYILIAVCHAISMTSSPLNALLYGWYNPSINRELIAWSIFRRNRPPADTLDTRVEESNILEGGPNSIALNDNNGHGPVKTVRVHLTDVSDSAFHSNANSI